MKRYIITQPKEQGIYKLGDNIYLNINIKDTLTNGPTDPSVVSLSIYGPLGSVLVSHDSLTKPTVGSYYYDYSIPTVGCYGIYTVELETTGYNTLTDFYFVLFPFDVVSEVRRLSGAMQQNDMSDYKIALIGWTAFNEVLETIYELRTGEKPLRDPVSCAYTDGVNKRFQLKNYPIADADGDGTTTGYGNCSCTTDVTVVYVDSTGASQIGNVKIIDASTGLIEITDTSNVALPSSTRGVYVTYYSQSESYNFDLMKQAIALLAAYEVGIAFANLGTATLADLQSNRALLTKRFLDPYMTIIDEIGFPMIGGGR